MGSEPRVASVDFSQLTLGRVLGCGCFADVHELLQFTTGSDPDQDHQDDEADDPEPKFAIKTLRTDFDNPKKFRVAAKDIETETTLLSEVDHPNIIKLYAKSSSGTDASSCTKENVRDFFFVMDRLSGTLSGKIRDWKRTKGKVASTSLFARRKVRDGQKQTDLFMERLRTALDITSALVYLHENGIVYRDLKADNVGFDMQGKVKLFDFGLARRLPDDPELIRGDKYIMSGVVGSLPHMAPEVWKKEPYNEKADVYSFAILLWMILTLELPYIELASDLKNLTTQVMINGYRPAVSSKWPKYLQELLRQSWSQDSIERLRMQEVRRRLEDLVDPAVPTPKRKTRPRILAKRSSYL